MTQKMLKQPIALQLFVLFLLSIIRYRLGGAISKSLSIMAKQKDQGDLLEIYFDTARDSISKFQKTLRKVILSEKKNIMIDMTYAPSLPRDYLSSLVFGAKALKSHGYTISFLFSPVNYSLLKSSPDSAHFQLEISQVVEDKDNIPITGSIDIPEETQDISSAVKIQKNRIIVTEETQETIPGILSSLVQKILNQGYTEVAIDLTELFLLSHSLIHALILETLNTGNVLKVCILESMEEVLQANPQAIMLNVEIKKEEDSIEQDENEKETEPANAFMESEEFLSAQEVSSIVDIQEAPKEDSTKNVASVSSNDAEDTSPSAFKIEVNRLKAGQMTGSAFLRDFDTYFQNLFSSGNSLYIDLSEFENIDCSIALKLIYANFQAIEQEKKLTIQLLQDQMSVMQSYLPALEKIEKKVDLSPHFDIIGSRMEIYNVSMPLFLQKFSESFKPLLNSGYSSLVIDISRLSEITEQAIELLVLAYLDAIGAGLSLTVRISSGMEANFQKSGRSRALPLEVLRPATVAQVQQKAVKPRIDMSKIREAMGKDRLTEKVIHHQYETVHIESRGTFQNWEPIPVKDEAKKAPYLGVERRLEKRYDSKDIEVIFARGSIAKITGRKYPAHNISQSGICFTCPIPLTRNESLRLKIFYQEISFEIQANVIWTKPVPAQSLFRTGVQFSKVSEVSKLQLKEIIRKLYKSE